MSNLVATEVTLQQVVEAMGGDEATETNQNIVAKEDTLKKLLGATEAFPQKILDDENRHIYGVSGILGSSPALTRMYDSVGLTAAVGTDQAGAYNSFDTRPPFTRRKCVGTWSQDQGKAVFNVAFYEGEEGYTEDGTAGDYVAVECPRAYYKMDGNELAISAMQHDGFRPFAVFCHDRNPDDTMECCYLPAYALALDANGHAASLPGLDNLQGDYKTLWDAARTYGGGSMGNFANLQPAEVNFYEWCLFTVEFATLNCQSVMNGCCNLRSNNDDSLTFIDAAHALVTPYNAARVVGEYVSVIDAAVDINDKRFQATHKILSVVRCDSSGTESSSGTYQKLELQDLGRDYYDYDTTGATQYKVAARAYRTGACNDVKTPSGSPVSNSDGYHPMRYRYRENVYGNQFKTSADLFNARVGTGDDDYYLEWYLLADPSGIATPKNFEASDLASDAFVKLGVKTEHENYASGYIVSKKYDEDYPDIWIPYVTTGGSGTTYFCDYAYLVSGNAVRVVRFGGNWNNGANDGFSNANANNAPGNGNANYGGDLNTFQFTDTPKETNVRKPSVWRHHY